MKALNFLVSIMWGIGLIGFGVLVLNNHWNESVWWNRVPAIIFGFMLIVCGSLSVPLELMKSKSEKKLYDSLNEVGKRLVDAGVPIRAAITAHWIVREEAFKLFEHWEQEREHREKVRREQNKDFRDIELG
jgi:hypothetical protein